MQKISILALEESVYALNPKSVRTLLSFSRRYTFSPTICEPKPNWGTGFPVIKIDIKIAGTI